MIVVLLLMWLQYDVLLNLKRIKKIQMQYNFQLCRFLHTYVFMYVAFKSEPYKIPAFFFYFPYTFPNLSLKAFKLFLHLYFKKKICGV